MGVIYTPEQLQKGSIPGPNDQVESFKKLFDRIRTDADRLQVGLFIAHGSVADTILSSVTRHHIDSDIDGFVVLDAPTCQIAYESKSKIEKITAAIDTQFNVATEVRLALDSDDFREALRYDVAFGRWLLGKSHGSQFAYTREGSAAAKELRMFEESELDPAAIMKSVNHYLADKRNKFKGRSARTLSDDDQSYRTLQRFLEFPSKVALKSEFAEKHGLKFQPSEVAVDALEILSALRRDYRSRMTEYAAIIHSGKTIGQSRISHYIEWLERNYPKAHDAACNASTELTYALAS
jgi:hypothetical protein